MSEMAFSDAPSLRESPLPSFIEAYEKAEALQLAARAASQAALDLQRQADKQRRIADGLFQRMVYAQASESNRKDGSSHKDTPT